MLLEEVDDNEIAMQHKLVIEKSEKYQYCRILWYILYLILLFIIICEMLLLDDMYNIFNDEHMIY